MPAFIVISICQIRTGLLLFFCLPGASQSLPGASAGEHRDDVSSLSSAWCLCLAELCSPGGRFQAWMTLVHPVGEDCSGNWVFSKRCGFSLCCLRQSYFHPSLLSPVYFIGCCQWRELFSVKTLVGEEKGG